MSHQIKHFVAAVALCSAVVPVACGSDESHGAAGPSPDGGAGNPATEEAGAGGHSSGGADAGTPGTGGKGGGGSPASDAATSTADAAIADGGECASGCSCGREETCEFACTAGCTVECLGGTCAAGCSAGGCTLDSDFGGQAEYTCLGGGCHTDCDTGSTCDVDCSGGGCDVLCDGGSTCTVKCSPTGAPCAVTCENGGAATCLTGNCTMTGCGDGSACDPTPDSSYAPTIVPADFSSNITNTFSPFKVGSSWTMKSSTEDITITVLPDKKTILGVECAVVRDTVRDPKTGEILEDTLDWYAQNKDGSVWYFGEDTKAYVAGQPASTYGAWEAGVGGALPGIVMPADPVASLTSPPTPYRQEYWVCEAEDQAQVIETNVSVTVTSGTYTGCIRTREFTRLDPAGPENKVYCPDVGNVLVEDANTNQRLEQLTTVTIP